MIKRVAVIGAGAGGAAAAAALKAEDYFDEIKVYERRETAGGTWIYDASPGHLPLTPGALPPEIDQPLAIPEQLPRTTAPTRQIRFDRTPIYEDLTTNVPDAAMSFSDLPFPYGPFVHNWVPKQYVESYFSWHQTDSLLALNTTVEDLSKLDHDRWRLVLRKHDPARQVDDWWEEEFDGVIIANGHYSVPFIPPVPGLPDFMTKYPSRIEHSKVYRTPKAYANKRVVVVGNSASGYDVAQQLLKAKVTKGPIYVSRRSRGRWDGDAPPDGMEWKPVITEFKLDGRIIFADGTTLDNVDVVVYCTGYKASYPFWNDVHNGRPFYDYKADRIINSYQHTFVQDLPTLGIVGIARVLTFRSFEYQAIALARLWSGRSSKPLPNLREQQDWEWRRSELTRRERRKFHQIDWDTGETIEWFTWLFDFAGLPLLEGSGSYPPVLDRRTRWAIENIKKYPEHGGSRDTAGVSSADSKDEWVFIDASPQKDSLHFI